LLFPKVYGDTASFLLMSENSLSLFLLHSFSGFFLIFRAGQAVGQVYNQRMSVKVYQ
jgi:hypothetical protein